MPPLVLVVVPGLVESGGAGVGARRKRPLSTPCMGLPHRVTLVPSGKMANEKRVE